jgi:PAS domain S-box-containing protein
MKNKQTVSKSVPAENASEQIFLAVDIIEEMSDPVVLLNLDKQIKKFNRAFTDIIGYGSESIDRYLCEFFIEKDRDKLCSAINEGVRLGFLKNFETRLITKEKKKLPVLINLTVSRDDKGIARSVIAVIRDISELKQTQNLLKENVEMNRALMNAISESVLLMDTRGIVLAANQTVAQRVGTSVDSLINRCFFDFFPPEVANERRSYADRVIQTKQPIRFVDERFGRKISNIFYPLLDEAGEVYRLAALGFDVTELKLAEKEIHDLARFPGENPNPILRINPNGTILYANAAVRPLLKIWNSGIGGTVPEILGDLVSKAIESRTSRTVDTYVGEQFYTFILAPIVEEGYVNIYGTDISRQKQAESRLQDYAERLAIINRLDHIISSSLEFQMIYDGFVKEMERLIAFDRTAIVLIDDSRQNFEIVQQWTRFKPNFQVGERFSLNGTEIEWIVNHKIAWVEANLGEKGDFTYIERLRQEGIRSRMLLPLMIQGQVIGILSLGSFQSGYYSESSLDVIMPLADQLAIGVQNSRLYALVQQRSNELEQRVDERTIQLAAANQELQASRARLQVQFDRMPVGCFIYDQDLRIQSMNPAAEAIFGLSVHEAIGKDPLELTVPALVIPEVADVFWRVKQGEVINQRINENITQDGRKILVEWSNTPIFDETGKFTGMIAMAQDVTERVLSEAAIQNLNEDLKRQAQDLQTANRELESFSYSVSHDLRAPLRSIDGFSRILIEEYQESLNPEAQRFLNLVRDNAQQMGRLIDDLLAFSRLGRQFMNIQMLQPRKLVDEALNILQSETTGRQVELSIGSLPECQADPALLKLVFVNLISNALKYTRKTPQAEIEIGCQWQNGEQVYFVKDNGVGFDMQYADKLFGVFQRLHRAEDYEGTGVGLANVQRIIHRHGGRVWAEGQVNHGAAFYFTLAGGIISNEQSS